jgi:hypothetical protein
MPKIAGSSPSENLFCDFCALLRPFLIALLDLSRREPTCALLALDCLPAHCENPETVF